MPAIKVEGLGKSYLVGHNAARAERYTALRDVVARNVRDLARKTRDMIHGRPIIQGDEVEEFWALKDISFEVEQGETLGIIGRNGAGKSTLLKVLSRITEPTKGRITLQGRVASLLEVGTGFHPELTGRENIYLNGAILGMTRREIRRRFDEIVAFAEVERFLDTPVKRYSSGMYVRLAFAVAAHLDPEILVIDEVLAVGDMQFQDKCLGKMREAGKSGRTVLFVSHNLNAVNSFCTTALVLKSGVVQHLGTANSATAFYSNEMARTWEHVDEIIGQPCIRDIYMSNAEGNRKAMFFGDEPCFMNVILYTANVADVFFAFTIFNSDGTGILASITSDDLDRIEPEHCQLIIEIPIQLLNPGDFRVEGALGDAYQCLQQSECLTVFTYVRNSKFDIRGTKSRGLIRIPGPWRVKDVP